MVMVGAGQRAGAQFTLNFPLYNQGYKISILRCRSKDSNENKTLLDELRKYSYHNIDVAAAVFPVVYHYSVVPKCSIFLPLCCTLAPASCSNVGVGQRWCGYIQSAIIKSKRNSKVKPQYNKNNERATKTG